MPTQPLALAYGAMLAAGDDGVLAGRSAAAFYGAIKPWPEVFELISPRRLRVPGLEIRQCSTLGSRDVWRFDGLRVTSPARTALDLAATVSDDDRLHAIIDRLRLDRPSRLTIAQLTDILARNPRHLGAARLRRVTGQLSERPSRSRQERAWKRYAKTYDLPPYETNIRVAGHEVDVLVAGCVIVELDTTQTHWLNFESDRRRDAEILARTGIPTIRVLDTQLEDEPAEVAAWILEAVARQQAVRRQSPQQSV